MPLIANTRALFRAIEARAAPDEIAAFYTADAIQVQHPNLMHPRGVQMNVAAMKKSVAAARHLLREQSFVVESATADSVRARVFMEVGWSGTLAVPFGSREPGAVLRARVAMVLAFRDGLIAKQTSYACIEPF